LILFFDDTKIELSFPFHDKQITDIHTIFTEKNGSKTIIARRKIEQKQLK